MSSEERDLNRVEILKLLYPIFKREVYDRREAIMRLTRFGGASLVGLTVLFSSSAPGLVGPVALRWLVAGVVGLFAASLIHQIRQHKVRHARAKRELIRVEEALGLFEEGAYLEKGGLYPAEWRSLPASDPDAAVSAWLLLALAALAMMSVLLA
jgi:hypothetical protein